LAVRTTRVLRWPVGEGVEMLDRDQVAMLRPLVLSPELFIR
jgi:hypothetical protein